VFHPNFSIFLDRQEVSALAYSVEIISRRQGLIFLVSHTTKLVNITTFLNLRQNTTNLVAYIWHFVFGQVKHGIVKVPFKEFLRVNPDKGWN